MRPTSPSPSIVAQPSTMPSRRPTFSSTDCRKADPLSTITTPVTLVSAWGSMDVVLRHQLGVLLFKL